MDILIGYKRAQKMCGDYCIAGYFLYISSDILYKSGRGKEVNIYFVSLENFEKYHISSFLGEEVRICYDRDGMVEKVEFYYD